ncbi:methyltransferase-like protein 27 [Styela clava]
MSATASTKESREEIYEQIEPRSRRKKLRTFYDNWAQSYDWDMLDMGYSLHSTASILLMERLSTAYQENCVIIDVGCGTGLVGSVLRKKGYCGILHGVDENKNMLNVANRKNAYNDLYLQYMSPIDPISVEILYDAFVCVAAFGLEHIHPLLLPHMVDHVKPGGVMVFSVANHILGADRRLLESEINKLVDSKVIRKISATDEFYFKDGRESRDTDKIATCRLYCYVKSKRKNAKTKVGSDSESSESPSSEAE